jgi:hypothetical protein
MEDMQKLRKWNQEKEEEVTRSDSCVTRNEKRERF